LVDTAVGEWLLTGRLHDRLDVEHDDPQGMGGCRQLGVGGFSGWRRRSCVDRMKPVASLGNVSGNEGGANNRGEPGRRDSGKQHGRTYLRASQSIGMSGQQVDQPGNMPGRLGTIVCLGQLHSPYWVLRCVYLGRTPWPWRTLAVTGMSWVSTADRATLL